MQALTPLLIDVLLKSAIILLLAGLITLAMRRHSAAARHLVWAVAVASVLALPVLGFLLPGLAILPAGPFAVAGEAEVDVAAPAAPPPTSSVDPFGEPEPALPPDARPTEARQPLPAPSHAPPSAADPPVEEATPARHFPPAAEAAAPAGSVWPPS